MKNFDIAFPEDILNGSTTDIYFKRSETILKKEGINRNVAMEVAQKGFPEEYDFGIFTGLYNVLDLLENKPVDIYSIDEGSLFFEDSPVMTVVGNYLDFGVYETAILGFLCHCSGISSKAAKCKLNAGEKPVLSFGARRAHPAISGMIDKYAYIGGCDGFSVVFTEKMVDKKASGTVPHALILQIGDTAEAMRLFDIHIEPEVDRFALIDTFNDERFEAVNVAGLLKEKLDGIRIDTPSSRRGNLKKIAEEIRWELALRGYEYVKLFASGGLDEHSIAELSGVIDGFGIGTSISNAKVMDFSMDIVEINGKPFSKKGKFSGFKELYQCENCLHQKFSHINKSLSICEKCGGEMNKLTKKVMENGKILIDRKSPEQIRESVVKLLPRLKGIRDEQCRG